MAGSTTGAAKEGPSPKDKTTDTVLSLHMNSVAQDPTNTDQNAELQGRNVSIVGDLDNQDNGKTEVKHIDTEEQSPDYAQHEYTTPYYLTNDQVKASVKCLIYSQSPLHAQYKHRTHKATVGNSVSGILTPSD